MAKKFLTAVVLVCAIAMISTCAFAAISEATGTYDASTGAVTVTCKTDAATSSVSLMGLSKDWTSGAIAASQITCIDQQDSVASSTVTFTCKVDTAKFDTTKVYLGGTGVTSKVPVTFTETPVVPDEPEKPELVFTTNTGVTAPFGQSDGKILRFSGLTATQVVELTTTDGSVLKSKTYTTTDGELIHIIAVPYGTDVPQSILELKDGTPDAVKFGDANGDGTVNSSDSTLLARSLAGYKDRGGNVFAPPTSIDELTVWDANGDGAVNSSDSTLLGRALAGYKDRGGNVFSPDTMDAYKKK